MYIAEISASHCRGFFCSFLSLCLAFGITYVTVIGSYVPDWKIITVACIVPVVLGMDTYLTLFDNQRQSLNYMFHLICCL